MEWRLNAVSKGGEPMITNPTHFKRRALVLAAAGLLAVPWLAGAAEKTTPDKAHTDKPLRILVMGDSLSAEYGLPRGTGWVALMDERMKQQGVKGEIVNASISGETTAGGLRRLPALLGEHKPTHVLIELGANDALRGLPLKGTQDNLQAMITASQRAPAKVLLIGMMVPPNYGKRYADDFHHIYGSLAGKNKAALVPFFLKGVADRPDARDWFQADGTHPKAKAHGIMLDQVWQVLKPLL
jgi:acyl-CoA thioesterase-1